MYITYLTRAIAIALFTSMGLAACGGGGGAELVRQTPPPAAPPPTAPPPTAPNLGPCPMPITGNCIVTSLGTMLGGRTSSGQLVVRLPTQGNVADALSIGGAGDVYTFSAGTRIESGALGIHANNALNSDVTLLPTLAGVSRLVVAGTVNGRIDNAGEVIIQADGTVRGNVANQGLLWLDPLGRMEGSIENHGTLFVHAYHIASLPAPTQIMGSFRQASGGILSVALPTSAQNVNFFHTLRISGRADLGGTLELRNPSDGWDAWPLPNTPSSAHILHADGGIFGAFDRWTSPGLFVEGSLRYGSNDVWFDLTRISVQAAMAGQGIGGITLASAGNLDRVLGVADGYAQVPRTALNADRQRFLQSAGRLLWQDDAAQAARSLDSIAGHGHMQLVQAQYALAGQSGTGIARHATQLQAGAASAWSDALAYGGSSAGIQGYDRWLGPHLLMGGSISQGKDALGFAQLGGHASGNDQMASLYLHHRGDRWQATAVGMAGRSARLLQRQIELDDDGQHVATSRRRLSLAGVHGELARPVSLVGGSLQPFVALDYAAMRSARFHEAGDTGFELVAGDAMLRQLSASWGMRYARQWRWGDDWLGLQAEWQALRPLASDGAMSAAFVGAPEALFDLAALEGTAPRRVARLGLEGGIDDHWRWSLQGLRGQDRRGSQAWQVRLAREF